MKLVNNVANNSGFDDFGGFDQNDFDDFVSGNSDNFDDFGGDIFNDNNNSSESSGFNGNSQNNFMNNNDNFGEDAFSEESNDNSQYNSNAFSEEANDTNNGLNKKSLIMIFSGVALLIVVIIIASAITKSSKNKQNTVQQVPVQQVTTQQVINSDDIMNSQQTAQQPVQQPVQQTQNNTVVNNVKTGGYIWTTITSSENVVFNANTTDMTFTVTNIEHRARAVDASETLVVKTTLQGSISGLAGTYELDVPYDKGIILEQRGIGTQFTVHVQLGEYNGRTVVGAITY